MVYLSYVQKIDAQNSRLRRRVIPAIALVCLVAGLSIGASISHVLTASGYKDALEAQSAKVAELDKRVRTAESDAAHKQTVIDWWENHRSCIEGCKIVLSSAVQTASR